MKKDEKFHKTRKEKYQAPEEKVEKIKIGTGEGGTAS